MPFKPNYNQQRAERNRAKEQKKQEKLQRRAERTASRDTAASPEEESQEIPAGSGDSAID
jgi:hypothetical protein